MIKFFMSNGQEIELHHDLAEQVLKSSNQLVTIIDGGKWTGTTINKAHIVNTSFSYDEPTASDAPRLPEGKIDEAIYKRNRETIDRIGKQLREKFGWKPRI